MASSTRSKAPQKGAKGKSGRRLPPKVKTGPDIPLLPIVVAGLLVALFAGIIIYYAVNSRPTTVASAAGIPCDQLEHTQTHYHAALQIVHEGVLTPLPGAIGIQGSESSPTCYYWLHVHTANQDVIHIESPSSDTFTLSQFFAVWNAWSTSNGGPKEPLDATHVSTFSLTPGEKLYVYIDLGDGKGPQLFSGDPNTIVLKAHEVISIEISSGPATPPPGFDWTAGSNAGL
ncbi:MAG TPA: hypothetical protein VF956_11545 [Candidatus Dormibacteraeota bacterium]